MVIFLCLEKYFIDAIVDFFSSLHSSVDLDTRALGGFSIVLQTKPLDGGSAKILPITRPPLRDCDKINDYKIFKIVHAL